MNIAALTISVIAIALSIVAEIITTRANRRLDRLERTAIRSRTHIHGHDDQ